MKTIIIEPGYHEWLLKVDGKISCSLGDITDVIFTCDEDYPVATKTEFVEGMIDEINQRQKYPEEYAEYQQLKYPVDIKEDYEQLNEQLSYAYDYYVD